MCNGTEPQWNIKNGTNCFSSMKQTVGKVCQMVLSCLTLVLFTCSAHLLASIKWFACYVEQRE